MLEDDSPPSSPSKVAISVRGSQPVGLRKKPGPVDKDLDLLDGQRHAPEHLRDVGGDHLDAVVGLAQRRCGHQHDVAEVDRADLGRTRTAIEAASPGWIASAR